MSEVQTAAVVPPGRWRYRVRPTGRLGRRSARALLLGLVIWLLLPAPAARAHALLTVSDPVDGAVLAGTPFVAHLWFSEDIVSGLSTATVLDSAARTVPAVQRAAAADDELAIRLPRLAPGSYGIRWRVLARDDGHATSGTVLFTVGAGQSLDRAAFADPAGLPVFAVLEWCWLLVLCLLIGSTVLSLLAEQLRCRMRALLAWAAVVGLVLGIAEVAGRAHQLGGLGWPTWWTLLAHTHWGQLWVLRLALLAAVPVAVRRSWALPVPVIAIAASEGAQSHAAAGAGAPLAITLDTVHILAAGAWIGSILGLLVLTVLALRARHQVPDVLQLPGLAVRFSVTAFVSVGVLVASGLSGAGRQVGPVSALVDTRYGRLLLLKVALLAILLVIGAANLRRLQASAALSSRLLAVEAVLGVITLFVAALLAQAPPGRTAVAAGTGVQQVLSSSDWVVEVRANPGRPGTNAFTVQVSSTRRPPRVAAQSPELTLRAADDTTHSIPLRQLSTGEFFGTGSLAGSTSQVAIGLRLADGSRSMLVAGWPESSAAVGAPGWRWSRLSSYTDPAALLWLLVMAGLARRIWRRPAIQAGAKDPLASAT